MELKIQGSSSFNLSERIKDYIERKVEKLNYFKNHIDKLSFHLESEKLLYKVNVTLSIKKFGVHKFEADSEEIYTAIDKVVHKIDTKIQREKTRIQDHSGSGHEGMNEDLVKEKEEKEPAVKLIDITKKPTTLTDAYLQLGIEEDGVFGFNLINEQNIIAPAFLRKVEDETVYLLKQIEPEVYSETLVKKSKEEVKEGKKTRKIELKKMGLKEAQSDILELEFPYNVFFNRDTNKITLIYKESNEKWTCVS